MSASDLHGRRWCVVSTVVAAMGACSPLIGGCLDRPVVASSPRTTTRITDAIREHSIDKIDLLFMIDNSSSMGDKQKLLAEAVPDLVEGFLDPPCVDTSGNTVQSSSRAGCPDGAAAEFVPVNDIHIGIVSSSLGEHGAAADPHNAYVVCPDAPPTNDFAHLLARGLPAGPSFLAWGPGGILDAQALDDAFRGAVAAVGEDGCAYESQLESWYRFLVDPTPPKTIVVDATGSASYGEIDTDLLSQRASFLRPDSLLAVIMITDEDDASVMDIGRANLLLVTDQSGNNPYLQLQPRDGKPNPPNLRTDFDEQRFGARFLWPVERYSKGLSAPSIVSDKDQKSYPNPIFADLSCPDPNAGCTPKDPRDPTWIFLAGIVGVPWQDIARVDPASNRPDLSRGYMTADELTASGRWAVILGDPENGVAPTDPFMIPSREPRTGTNPVTGDSIQPPSSPGSAASPINGHEWTSDSDLQFACIFPLPEGQRACDDPDSSSCDCAVIENLDQSPSQNPLCQAPDGSYGHTQFFGKAYPGVRELQAIEAMGKQGVVASICPASVDTSSPVFGYRAAIAAIAAKLAITLKGRCLSRQLEPSDACATPGSKDFGHVDCVVLEAQKPAPDGACPPCAGDDGRIDVPSGDLGAVTDMVLSQGGSCVCELLQLDGDALDSCLNDGTADQLPGWCYVDPTRHMGNPDIVAQCSASEKRLIRYWPTKGTTAFISCQESPVGEAESPADCAN